MTTARPNRRRYIVIGAGAVGAALAAGFESTQTPVVLVSRGATYAAIRERGLRVRHNGMSRVLAVPTVDGPESVTLTEDDVLLFAVKTQDAHGVVAQWAAQPVTTADGTLTTAGAALVAVTFQNGLEAERVALRHFEHVIAATTLIGARHVVAGEIDIVTAPHIGSLVLGALLPRGPRSLSAEAVGPIAHELREAGWTVEETDDPAAYKAWKTAQAAAFAVEVLDGTPEELDDLRARVRDEAFEVLAGAGIAVAERPTRAPRTAAPTAAPAQLSTWQSFARGAGSEVDHLAGEIALTARLHGLPAPVNTALQRVLAASAAAGERPGARHVSEVLALADSTRELVSPSSGGIS